MNLFRYSLLEAAAEDLIEEVVDGTPYEMHFKSMSAHLSRNLSKLCD